MTFDTSTRRGRDLAFRGAWALGDSLGDALGDVGSLSGDGDLEKHGERVSVSRMP